MSQRDQSAKLQRIHNRFQTDFPFFAVKALKIKDKDTGQLTPFVFKKAQRYLHSQLQKQLRETGRIRAVILKGRQQGCSTYVGARYYHKATRKEGQSVFILSHEAKTTAKLFAIVERYYDNTPPPLRPGHTVSNRQELKFEGLGSEYAVGTAGNKTVGRGGTIQLFHGSEVAFWENTDDIQTGIIESVPDAPGTEIILESTANGMGNMFYDMCMDAIAGKGDYILVFIPWFWQEEYQRSDPHDGNVELTDEEVKYQSLYEVTTEQLYWRRAKIAFFKSTWKFKQEYPSFPMEAFQTSGDQMIDASSIMQARRSTVKDPEAPLVMGVDPGRSGDRTVFAYRRGREMLPYEEFEFPAGENTQIQMKIAGMIADRINRLKPMKVFIDPAEGCGVYDRLCEMGYERIVTLVPFGSKALNEIVYGNKRAEIWCLFRDWIHQEDGPVSLPDSDNLQKDVGSMPEPTPTSNSRIILPPKAMIRKKLGFSPDIGDACALTFSFPVAPQHLRQAYRVKTVKRKPKLRALQRMQA